MNNSVLSLSILCQQSLTLDNQENVPQDIKDLRSFCNKVNNDPNLIMIYAVSINSHYFLDYSLKSGANIYYNNCLAFKIAAIKSFKIFKKLIKSSNIKIVNFMSNSNSLEENEIYSGVLLTNSNIETFTYLCKICDPNKIVYTQLIMIFIERNKIDHIQFILNQLPNLQLNINSIQNIDYISIKTFCIIVDRLTNINEVISIIIKNQKIDLLEYLILNKNVVIRSEHLDCLRYQINLFSHCKSYYNHLFQIINLFINSKQYVQQDLQDKIHTFTQYPQLINSLLHQTPFITFPFDIVMHIFELYIDNIETIKLIINLPEFDCKDHWYIIKSIENNKVNIIELIIDKLNKIDPNFKFQGVYNYIHSEEMFQLIYDKYKSKFIIHDIALPILLIRANIDIIKYNKEMYNDIKYLKYALTYCKKNKLEIINFLFDITPKIDHNCFLLVLNDPQLQDLIPQFINKLD